MFDVFLLSIALSMDAFAVSIGLGAKVPCDTKGSCSRHSLALKAGIFFGFFQALMPFFGYMAGVGLMEYIESFDHFVAFFLLLVIGIKMIYEGMNEGVEESITKVSNKIMLLLAIATSIDAAAAGFTLQLLDFNPFASMVLIGVITFAMSYVGVQIGARSGVWLENKAEILGGIVLVGIGFKILLEGIGF